MGMEDKILKAIEGLRNDFTKKFDTLSGEVHSLSSEVHSLSSQVHENTQILKALEHQSEVNKAEHDKMFFDLAEIKGEVKSIRKDLSTVELVTANNWSDIVKLKAVK